MIKRKTIMMMILWALIGQGGVLVLERSRTNALGAAGEGTTQSNGNGENTVGWKTHTLKDEML